MQHFRSGDDACLDSALVGSWRKAHLMEGLLAGLRSLPNVHPLVVHVPVVLLPLGLGLDLLGSAIKRTDLQTAGRWALWAGTLGAAVAFYTGHEAAELAEPYLSGPASPLVRTHHNLGMATLVASVVLSLARLFSFERFPIPLRIGYLALAGVVVTTLVVGADIGGQLVYRHGVAVQVGADSLHGGAIRSTVPHHH